MTQVHTRHSLLTRLGMLPVLAILGTLTLQSPAAGPAPALRSLGEPLAEVGIPATNMWSAGHLLYGEAVNPFSDRGPFIAYDVRQQRLVYAGTEDIHTGFRNIAVDRQGNAYFSVNSNGLARYSPDTNSVAVLDVTLPGILRASTRQDSNGWMYAATSNGVFFRFDPDSLQLDELGSTWHYTTDMVLDPNQRYVYFVPGAHGSSWELGTPVIQFNLQTRRPKVIAFLNSFYETQKRVRLGGTYALDLDEHGQRLFINMNAVDLAREPAARSAFGDPAVVVVHLPPGETQAATRPRLRFEDVASPAGLEAPLWNSYIHTSSWGDVDGDGWLDLFAGTFVQGATQVPNKLLLNRNGTFVDSGQSAVERSGRAAGSVFADLDSDGDLDLYVSNNRIAGTGGPSGEPARLWRNDGGVFTDVTAGSGIEAQTSNGRQVGVLDYNADGLLDLFVVADALRGSGPSVLLANRGGLVFEEVTAAAGLPRDVHGLGLGIGDVTGDGWADIFVAGGPTAREAYRNYLFIANRDGTFRQLESSDFDWSPYVNGNEDWVSSAALGDVNRDGRLDILVGHHFGSSAERGVGARVRLYLNRALDVRGDPLFEDVTERAGLPPIVSKAPHVDIQDFDNDGWLDLYASVVIDTPGGVTPLIFSHEGNGGDPRFRAPDLLNPHYYAGGPVADFNRDGRLDAFLAEFRSVLQDTPDDQGVVPSRLMLNNGAPGNWLQVQVEDARYPMGLGAAVRIYRAGRADDATALLGASEISLGSGFASSGPAVAHFGLGAESMVDVVVAMPFNGPTHTRRSVPANRSIVLPNGAYETQPHFGLQAVATSDTSDLFLQPPSGTLPDHDVATTPPTVDFVLFPRPAYEGNPWSQWGGGLFASNHRFYAAIGDHSGRDGNAYLYEYDPITKKLIGVGDVLSTTQHVTGSWGHGKIHSRITEGQDGYVYMTSYWGTRTGLVFDQHYRGSVVLRYPIFTVRAAPGPEQPSGSPTPGPTPAYDAYVPFADRP